MYKIKYSILKLLLFCSYDLLCAFIDEFFRIHSAFYTFFIIFQGFLVYEVNSSNNNNKLFFGISPSKLIDFYKSLCRVNV